MKIILIVIYLLIPLILLAHGKQDHSADQEKKKAPRRPEAVIGDLQRMINQQYRQSVKPIFKAKCFDCHGQVDKYPWYFRVPGIKQIMEYDIREAKKHIDMSNDFPFGGHGAPLRDLESIRSTLKKGSMPPLRYLLIHWDSRLTQDEINTIAQWIDKAKAHLETLEE